MTFVLIFIGILACFGPGLIISYSIYRTDKNDYRYSGSFVDFFKELLEGDGACIIYAWPIILGFIFLEYKDRL